jgi:cardiolipin synthase
MPLNIDTVYLTAAIELLIAVVHLLVIGGVLLTGRRDPSATLAWILFIFFVPVIGVICYLILGRTRMRRTARRSGRAEERLRDILSKYDVYDRLSEQGCDHIDDPRTETQVRLGNALASTPATVGNKTRVLNNAASMYAEMIRAIEGARHHIHVEFYIIQPDSVGEALRDRLAARALSGIEVRVICDALGSAALPSGFWDPLIAAGGKAAFFSPIIKYLPRRRRRRDRVDFRNHRKIVVVDGRIGFTGGINVGREYLGLDPNIGRWRDTHIRIEGPAVLSLQQAFLQDWLMSAGEAPNDERYFPDCPRAGDCVVQVIDSGPDGNLPAMELYYAQAIALAERRVIITNPYFIPSRTIESALTMAALRGVEVKLLLPKKSDSLLVTMASQSYFAPLLQVGVRIFEYKRGFVHAKTMVVDEWLATIGSANMDMRSFTLNFELNAFVFSPGICKDIAEQFSIDLRQAAEVSLASVQKIGLIRRLAHGVARLLSPLL